MASVGVIKAVDCEEEKHYIYMLSGLMVDWTDPEVWKRLILPWNYYHG